MLDKNNEYEREPLFFLKHFSFTAANTIPIKIIKNSDLMSSLKNGKVIPYHLQLNPTNKCNFNCDFCSCRSRDEKLSLDFAELQRFLAVAKDLGSRSVTITGGGDPLCYHHIEDLIDMLHLLNIDAGLVCNGSLLKRLPKSILKKLVWCRISCSDKLSEQINVDSWFSVIQKSIVKAKNVDWAFSYVISLHPQYYLIDRIIRFANTFNFTHVRLVSDLLDFNRVPQMSTIKWNLSRLGADDSKVIYQGRKQFTPGTKVCYISLLKPVIGADGGIYPCCGVQYALDAPSLDYEKSMRMGDWFDLPDLIKKQKFFDGSNCTRCYYAGYNQMLTALLGETKHVRFV